MSVSARVIMSDYTNQVLNIVKAKYSLKDKSEALNRFVEEYAGEEFEPEVKPSYAKKLLKLQQEHFKKYGDRKMSQKEFTELFKR